MDMKNVIIADSIRTAWGKPGGGLAPFISSDFSAQLLAELMKRTGVEPAAVDQVVFGQAHPSTMPSNIGHYAWLKAELPVDVPGYTVRSNSDSALQALRSCYYLIATGNEEICVAGGADSYSAAPFVLRDVRNHFYPQHRTFIDSIEEAEQCTQPKPMTRAEQYKLAHGGDVSAEAVQYAQQSIARAQAADNAGQILPISYEVRKKGTVTVDADELLGCADAAAPLSPYADGAAVTMLMSEEKAKALGVAAKAVISGHPRSIDIGKFGPDRWFTYVAGFGAFTDVAYETPQQEKRVLGRLAYLLQGAKSLAELKPIPMRMVVDGLCIEDEVLLGLVCSTTSVGGFKAAAPLTKGVSLDDGLSEVIVAKNITNLQDLHAIGTLLVKREFDPKFFYTFQTDKIRFEFPAAVKWTIDGEFGGAVSAVDIENHNNAVRILVP